MKNKTVIVNIYNFIRMSHVEPSVFIQDDFETVKKQMILVGQYGFPATYALKYDALTEPRYQELIQTYAGENDEISAWWEITEELCRKAGVRFRGSAQTKEYDERVNSAYSIGYEPGERMLLVDAYMDDFRNIFGYYPKTIGSWVLDTVTISHAAERYKVTGSAICRDQMGTDGFTLWGGFPNGIYYPGRKNENIPSDTIDGQLTVPMFRLLGPDPIYSFEQDVRPGLHGVYTLEPSWLTGRDPDWIDWFFGCLTKEDTLGVGYAHVGQENNFLWENIRPGMEPQMEKLKKLLEEGTVRVETMADSAAWFLKNYRMTPPMTFQASGDWNRNRELSAQWYACCNYRIGFLGEKGFLRIRDFFLYRPEYASRYFDKAMTGKKSTFDALPVLYAQEWMKTAEKRCFIRLLDENGKEPQGKICYRAVDELTAEAKLVDPENGRPLAVFTMYPDHMQVSGSCCLSFDSLPVFFACEAGRVQMIHEGFSYGFEVSEGRISGNGHKGLKIWPAEGKISLKLGPSVSRDDLFAGRKVWSAETGTEERRKNRPTGKCRKKLPPMAPQARPDACVFPAGTAAFVKLTSKEQGEIRYTLDGTNPTDQAALYTGAIELREDATLRAALFLPDGRSSEVMEAGYRFGLPDICLMSPTVFDSRPVFCGNGVTDLLRPERGSLDYLDGRWRGTLADLIICGTLKQPVKVADVTIGFLSHHRSGIIYPESIQLYTGMHEDDLSLTAEIKLPCKPCEREIARQDVSLPVRRTIGCFRLVARRYEKMPQWCCYRGAADVFTMVDNLIVSPASS